jgi:hypothetical protein
VQSLSYLPLRPAPFHSRLLGGEEPGVMQDVAGGRFRVGEDVKFVARAYFMFKGR